MNRNYNLTQIEGFSNLSNEVQQFFLDFYESNYFSSSFSKQSIIDFFSFFIKNRTLDNKKDFSDDTFYEDTKIIKNSRKLITYREIRAILKRLYSYVIDNELGKFELLSKEMLNSNAFLKDIIDGHIMVEYDPMINIEWPDKVIFVANNKYYSFDFSTIKLLFYRTIIKKYIQSPVNPKLSTKASYFHIYVNFFNLMDKSALGHVTVKNIMDFKNQLPENNTSKGVYLSAIRTLLNTLKNMNLVDINDNTLKMLKATNVKSRGETRAFTKEQIEQLILYSESIAKKSEIRNERLADYYRLVGYIIKYLSSTAMRLSTILNLRLDDLVNEEGGIHYYITSSKAKETEKYNISNQIYSCHNDVMKITKRSRLKTNNRINYLFVILTRNGLELSPIKEISVNKTLKNWEKELELPQLGTTGLRNYYMQMISSKVANKSGDKALLESLTRHSMNVHLNNYYENNMEEIAVSLYGVMIGNETLECIVLPNNKELKEEQKVSHDCGYCSLPTCINKTKLECLVCHNFVITPECIPFFEAEIKRIDAAIYNEPISHEKEFLITTKKFLVKHLLTLKERGEQECKNK